MATWLSRQLQIGDLDPGAPELRADSRYNRDNAYITAHYRLSSDVFAVMVRTEAEGCLKHDTLVAADELAWQLQQVPGVQTSLSLADAVRQITAGSYEGQQQVADRVAQPGHAELRRPAGLGEQPGPVQRRVLGDAG